MKRQCEKMQNEGVLSKRGPSGDEQNGRREQHIIGFGGCMCGMCRKQFALLLYTQELVCCTTASQVEWESVVAHGV